MSEVSSQDLHKESDVDESEMIIENESIQEEDFQNT